MDIYLGLVNSEIWGTYGLIMTVYSFAVVLGSFGIDFSAIKLISEELNYNNKNAILKISKQCITFSLISGMFSGLILLIFSKIISQFLFNNQINSSIFLLIVLAIPFISVSSCINGYFIAIKRVYKVTIAQFFEQIIKFFMIYIFLHFTDYQNLNSVCFYLILGDLISEIIAFILNYLLYIHDSKIYKTNYIINLSWNYYFKKIIFISLPIAITTLLRSLLSSIKQFIIPFSFSKGSFNYNQAISIYGKINGMAFPIIMFPSIIFRSISSLLVPEFSGKKNKMKIKKAIKIILLISIASSFFLSSLIFLFSNLLSNLIYHNLEISFYLKILAPVTIFILLDCVIDNILRGIDKQNNVMYINIFDVLFTTLLIYFIVPKYEINGYIFCIYFSEIFNLLLSFELLIKSLL